jgi:translation initiation factor 3 subunit J
MENMRKKLEEEGEEDSSESETDRRTRLRRTEQAADLKHAEDLFGAGPKKKAVNKAVITLDPKDPSKSVDLASLPLFQPTSKEDFAELREILAPILNSNAKKAQYTLFMQEFAKDILKDLPSDQIKKIGSSITALSNEKLKEEKAADKTGKKSKAAKTKASLVANRDTNKADTTSYEDLQLDE